MSRLVIPDISNHNAVLTTAYGRDAIITKASQGTYFIDPHIEANKAAAAALFARGRFAGQVGYHVLTDEPVGRQFDTFVKAFGVGGKPPPWGLGGMQDLETWDGTTYEMHGDHSAAADDFNSRVADWFETPRAAWIYGNAGNLAELAPHRSAAWPLILAAYTSELRYSQYGAGIGQQYTDGEDRWAVPTLDGSPLPRYTATLGNVDHSVFPGFADAFALRRWIFPTLDLLEQIMTLDRTSADYKHLIDDLADEMDRRAEQRAVVARARTQEAIGNGLEALKSGKPHGWFTHETVPILVPAAAKVEAPRPGLTGEGARHAADLATHRPMRAGAVDGEPAHPEPSPHE